jgi:hypothetical protein
MAFLTALHDVATQCIFGLLAFAVAAGMGVYLKYQGEKLKPPGIICFELAFTASRARRIVEGWSGFREVAVGQVRADYLFIAGYTGSFLFVCFHAADYARHSGHANLAGAADLAGYGALIAGLLDCVENVGLLRMLAGGISTPVVLVTSLSAAVKFALLGMALVAAGAVSLWSWWSPALA